MLNKKAANCDPRPALTLFSMIRTRYVNIVEEILISGPVAGVTQAILDDFKEKHSSGAFFCRYHKCSRAAQGYDTPELRHTHEESHVSKFLCAEATCGFFGCPFPSRAAIRKHTIQYHDQERIASIPDFLENDQCRSHKDRSLFTLTKSKEKRKIEESSSPRSPSRGNFINNDDHEFSRASMNGNNNYQMTPWREDGRGLGTSFAQGGPPVRNGYSVSPRDLQQYTDNYVDEIGVAPEVYGKETGHSCFSEGGFGMMHTR